MGKRKKPSKPRDEAESPEPQPETQPTGELLPPVRRPPTAVGAGMVPQEPSRQPSVPAAVASARPTLSQFIHTVRTVVGAMLDIADAAAEEITKRLQRR